MKSNRTFNRLIGAVAAIIGMGQSGPRHYADPVFTDPRSRRKKRAHGHFSKGRFAIERRKRISAPPCIPGTITYFDWLVRELGYDRRLADGYMYAFLNGYKIKMPMPLVSI